MESKVLTLSTSTLVNDICNLKDVAKDIPYNLSECLVTPENCEDLKLALMRASEFPIKYALETGCPMLGWTIKITPIFNIDNATKLPSILPLIPVVMEKDKVINIIANMHMLKIKKSLSGDLAFTADGKAIMDFLTLAYVFAFAVISPNKLRVNDGLFRNLIDMYVSMLCGSVFRGTTLATDENNVRIITYFVTRFITEGMLKEENPSLTMAKSLSGIRDDYFAITKMKYPNLVLTFENLLDIISKEIPAIAVKKFNTIFAHQSWSKSYGALFSFSIDYLPYLITIAYTRQMQFRYSTIMLKTVAEKSAFNVSGKVKDIIKK